MSWAWWHMPVISVIQETEVGDSLDCLIPGGRGCNELRLHHHTSVWATEQDTISNKQKSESLSLRCSQSGEKVSSITIKLYRVSTTYKLSQYIVFNVSVYLSIAVRGLHQAG